MAQDAFSQLIDALVNQEARRAATPPAAPRRQQPSSSGFDPTLLRRGGGPQFAKALSAQLQAAKESTAELVMHGFRPGMGVRRAGRSGAFRVVDIDPGQRRVRVRPLQDEPHHLNVTIEAPAATWIDVDAVEPAPEFDAPDAGGATFAKALGIAADRRTREANIQAIRERGRTLVTETRQRLEKALGAGEISGSDVRKSEIALNHFCSRLGL